MNKRQTVINAINHKETCSIPYYVSFTGGELQKMIDYTGDPDFFGSIGNYIDWTNATDHYVAIAGRPGFIIDEFGVEYDISDEIRSGIYKHALNKSSLADYAFPVPDESKIRANIETMLNNGKDTFKMVNVGVTLFERAWSIRGMEDILADMAVDEGFIKELLDRINEYNIGVMDIALEYEGFDAFYFGDDCGQQRGMIMGPEYWRKYIKPRLARLIDHSKKHGRYTVLHACGDQNEVLGDFAEIGLDVYETFQPEIYDLRKVKADFGDKLSFFGGISTQRVLPFGTPEEIKNVVRETISIMAKGGGYIAAPTHTIPSDVPPGNVLALIEAFRSA
ncbi:MAG: uroporphyrinogen decarboxylase family protein [Saccharofermentanales bacterium]